MSLSPPEPFTTLGAYNKLAALLTTGLRLGYAWDHLLIYATGGYAGGKIDGQYVCTAPASWCFRVPPAAPSPAAWPPSTPPVIPGTTAGTPASASNTCCTCSLVDVIVGAEYQHFELHSKTAFCFSPGCAILGPQDHINFEHGAHGDLARVRVSIKTQGWTFFWK